MATIFITGGTGCIGSVTIHKLLQSDEVERIVVATRSTNTDPLKLWIGDELDPRLEFVTLDVADYDAIEEVLHRVNPTHIIHLGAYQSPDCSKYHIQGMEINTGGTMVLFDVAEKLPRLKRFVFASSAAVYGMRSMYTESSIKEDAQLAPPNHYGIWKLAGEHLARLFYDNTQVPTVCLRLNTTYGKGRDKGKTSAPTNALKAIALGTATGEIIPFEMPYEGRENYHFVEDVGDHFASCTLQPYEGFGAFNIKGQTIEVEKFLAIVKDQAEKLGIGEFAQLSIANGAEPNLFVSDLSHEKIDRTFGDLPLTSIEKGVNHSLLAFQEMAKKGILNYSVESI
ncbi:NAD-dependent epimerase/dehydratase family protein [Fulvivirgaceae bacterium BMA10]|uniref:NAD-dependent epimerase/dehydratase family protein n=1 Tax=Splendidivirga corallicola TaxID=3051826 RepID=A0ABT8KGU3_9BACT|nr:NAD-dependent epimerase/dehydratase family protein [Fulvivirgaceae bacterium BMA10]